MNKTNLEKTTTGWFLGRWLIGFFGTMFIANAFFVWFALSTHTGNQDTNAYEEGLNYNQVLEQARKQELLGWHFNVDIMSDGTLLVSLFDKDGTPLKNSQVEAMLFNPTSDQDDRAIEVLDIADGQFSLSYNGIAHGQWELRLKVNRAEDLAEYRKKLVLP